MAVRKATRVWGVKQGKMRSRPALGKRLPAPVAVMGEEGFEPPTPCV